MKVVLPDNSELELPDGATGLDAARAIGPKLAEQAVLVRSNGRVQDLRLPLRDGQPIEGGFYYDFDFPEPICEEDLPRIEQEINNELAEGREWRREEVSAADAK